MGCINQKTKSIIDDKKIFDLSEDISKNGKTSENMKGKKEIKSNEKKEENLMRNCSSVPIPLKQLINNTPPNFSLDLKNENSEERRNEELNIKEELNREELVKEKKSKDVIIIIDESEYEINENYSSSFLSIFGSDSEGSPVNKDQNPIIFKKFKKFNNEELFSINIINYINTSRENFFEFCEKLKSQINYLKIQGKNFFRYEEFHEFIEKKKKKIKNFKKLKIMDPKIRLFFEEYKYDRNSIKSNLNELTEFIEEEFEIKIIALSILKLKCNEEPEISLINSLISGNQKIKGFLFSNFITHVNVFNKTNLHGERMVYILLGKEF